ncbi:hypothetical protein HJFPF1_00445 [Paramyrothecium foliicola]|nr:hypothetical protein HJFPF1_00445 [Paramyrothecium foliicola]
MTLPQSRLFDQAKLAVIGGVAFNHYMKSRPIKRRPTKDIDTVIDTAKPTPSAQQELLRIPGAPFKQLANGFHYNGNNDIMVRVDIFGVEILEAPVTLMRLGDLPDGKVPYIPITDLIFMKVRACGLDGGKNQAKHIDVAEKLVRRATKKRALLSLSEGQKRLAACTLEDIVTSSDYSERWRRRKLGL